MTKQCHSGKQVWKEETKWLIQINIIRKRMKEIIQVLI